MEWTDLLLIFSNLFMLKDFFDWFNEKKYKKKIKNIIFLRWSYPSLLGRT